MKYIEQVEKELEKARLYLSQLESLVDRAVKVVVGASLLKKEAEIRMRRVEGMPYATWTIARDLRELEEIANKTLDDILSEISNVRNRIEEMERMLKEVRESEREG